MTGNGHVWAHDTVTGLLTRFVVDSPDLDVELDKRQRTRVSAVSAASTPAAYDTA
jgi:hypothetical protein